MPHDNLRVTFLSVDLNYPPVVNYGTTTFPDLYAELAKRHRFERVTLEGEQRVTFETPAFRRCELDGRRLMLNEDIQRGFDLAKRDFGDILRTIKDSLEIPVFVGPQVKLRARWDGGETDYMAVIQRRALRLHEDQLRLLRLDELDSLGFQIHGDRDDVHYETEIMPSANDPSQLVILVTVYFYDSIETMQICEQRMQQTYDFLVGNVAPFIEALLEGGE